MYNYQKLNEGQTVKRITDFNDVMKFHVFNIRKKVFVEEQKVRKEDEYDQFEETSNHYIGKEDRKFVATARWRVTDEGIKLERFAVLPAYRNKGMGTALVNAVLEDVKKDGKKIYLHAQLPAVSLYERAGFVKEGPMFSECNIDHYKMVFKG